MSPQSIFNPSSDNLTEFQDFLQRIQTLQMTTIKDNLNQSIANKKNQKMSDPNAVDAMLGIEVGVEPYALMDFDEANNDIAEPRIGYTHIEQTLKNEEQNVLSHFHSALAISSNGDNKQSEGNVRVTVGIDKDLEMILEMDPSIVDLGDIAVTEPVEPKVIGLPPSTGGWVKKSSQ